jgi:hypothetical protein
MSKQSLVPVSADVEWARNVISGALTADIAAAIARARALKNENRFDLARRVLMLAGVAPGHAQYIFVHQQIANCTYKDLDLPMPHRFFTADLPLVWPMAGEEEREPARDRPAWSASSPNQGSSSGSADEIGMDANRAASVEPVRPTGMKSPLA